MNIRQRIAQLEQKITTDPIVLTMADGTEMPLPLSTDPFKLLGIATKGTANPSQQRQLDLIAQSVSSREPDGAHLVDLLRAYLNGPVRERYLQN